MELSKMYSEVFGILEALGEEYTSKIPKPMYEHIISEKSDKIEYDISKPIEELNISKEALEFIAYLNLRYWCDEIEMQDLLKIYKRNDEKIEEQLRKKYNPDKLFSKK